MVTREYLLKGSIIRKIERGTNKSGSETLEAEFEQERLDSNYIKQHKDFTSKIINNIKALEVIRKIHTKDGQDGLISLIDNSTKKSKDSFAKYLVKKYSTKLIKKLKTKTFKGKTKKITSAKKINNSVYLRVIKIKGKDVIRAFNIKTGRFSKTPETFDI